MTVRPSSDIDFALLRRVFQDTGYSERTLVDAVGTAAPPTRANRARFMHATRTGGPVETLARLFLAGVPVSQARALEVLPPPLVEACIAADLLGAADGTLTPRAMIVPLMGLLFASDAARKLGSEEAGEFVLPASTHASRHLLKLTIRRRVASMLDLGTGCGVQALVAAAHSDHAVATDVSRHAVRYAEFNARLNDRPQVECLGGDRFAPVAGRRFDLIVSNPPFVPAPDRAYTYRDAGADLDGFCRGLIEQAPAYLNPDGILQMLCEWVEIEGQPVDERIRAWVQGSGCDCWVLRSPATTPEDYAALRLGEVSGPEQRSRSTQDFDGWLNYFAERRVVAIHPGVIVLRRRSGRNWFLVQPLDREIGDAAGEGILAQFAAADFLGQPDADEALLAAALRPAVGLTLDQSHGWTGTSWRADRIVARLEADLPFDAELDPATAVLLRQFDGSKVTRDCLQNFARLTDHEAAEVTQTTLPVVRFLVQRGLLLAPAAVSAQSPQR